NQPLINSLNTLNTLKNSNPKELVKNLNKIQNSNQLDSSHLNELKDSRLDLIQLESKIQDTKNLNQLKESKNLNKIQMKSSKTTLSKISISIIASILLSQSLVALPSGGKFVGGSSGSIKVNGKEMNITGNNTNHIIAWGGGFNINQEESVNFNTSHKQQASFLNLDYTNKASQILGNLNGNGNNIYLVNPSGVLIGQNASINANKFVASNIIDNTTLYNFKDKVNDTNAITTFSPVFKPNKGNIVNLGSIRAREIVLIGNEVRNQAIIKENGKETIITGSFSGYNDKNPNSKIQNDSITLVGNIVDINIDTDVINSKQVWIAAKDKARINQSTSDIYFNGNRLVGNNALKTSNDLNASNIEWITYNGITNPKSIETYASIKDITDWYYFANGWNYMLDVNGDGKIDSSDGYGFNGMREIKDFELINNIDFSKGNKICLKANCDTQNGIEGVDYFKFSGNYADPNGKKEKIFRSRYGTINEIDTFYGDSMMVGESIRLQGGNYFSANFNGNNHTLSNVNIDTTVHLETLPHIEAIGIFGGTNTEYRKGNEYFDFPSIIKNLVIDNIDINVKRASNSLMVGGLIGFKYGSVSIDNIILNDINVFNNAFGDTGGLIGRILFGEEHTISNIILNNIGTISQKKPKDDNSSGNGGAVGGFAGSIESDINFSNIYLYFNSDSILYGDYKSEIAKFGYAAGPYDQTFSNVSLYYNQEFSDPYSVANASADDWMINNRPEWNKINLHTYTNSTNKRDEFNTKIKQTFGDNIVILGNDIEGWNYHFNPPLNNPTLPTLDMDNLFNKGGYFDSSSWLTKDDFNQSILNEILENLSFDILSLITDTNSLESALQSLDFLLHFINADKSGESGISLGNGIYGLMGYTLNQSQIDLLNSNNLLITQKLIGSINSLSLEDKHYIQEYKQKLETYQAKAKEFEESLKVISSDKHQALIEAFKQENGYYSLLDDRDRAEKIIKTAINNNGEFNLNNPYKIANGINVGFNLNTIEGINDKDGLNPDFTLPSANSSLFVKEDIE
ncbi:filamentous hemagglutinin N-terminal domain-containing protein, partial [Helicobacter pullorum]|uniref:filamentous hemagglutinin N-terminal domain-containing protein n=1 Tax=Helicobacter pullorum TaxID=35818 RepID=UPI000AB271CE